MSGIAADVILASLEATKKNFREMDRSTVYNTPASQLTQPFKYDIDLTLCVPCFNEEENIASTFGEIVTAMSGLELTWEMIVIDDASTDKTVAVVKKIMSDHPDWPIILVVREKNRGYAQNFIDAAFLGCGKYYRIINGDNSDSSTMISTILRHLGEADILIPYHTENPGRTVFRKALSRLFTALVNMLSGFKVRYYNSCPVHFRYDVMRWHDNGTGFDFQASLVVRLLQMGKTYLEIPVVGGERKFGQSKALTLKNFISSARFFADLAGYRIWKKLRPS
jgi:glycosyltransferase involved in cell wall biosynthesis